MDTSSELRPWQTYLVCSFYFLVVWVAITGLTITGAIDDGRKPSPWLICLPLGPVPLLLAGLVFVKLRFEGTARTRRKIKVRFTRAKVWCGYQLREMLSDVRGY